MTIALRAAREGGRDGVVRAARGGAAGGDEVDREWLGDVARAREGNWAGAAALLSTALGNGRRDGDARARPRPRNPRR